jgi:hypothetical protein
MTVKYPGRITDGTVLAGGFRMPKTRQGREDAPLRASMMGGCTGAGNYKAQGGRPHKDTGRKKPAGKDNGTNIVATNKH